MTHPLTDPKARKAAEEIAWEVDKHVSSLRYGNGGPERTGTLTIDKIAAIILKHFPAVAMPMPEDAGVGVATQLRNLVLADRGFDECWPLNPPLAPHSIAELARDVRWQAADLIEQHGKAKS